jgi:hypothetical protein
MTLKATCHCGDTRITLSRAPTGAKSCNCSFCERTGAVWAYFEPGEITVEATDEKTYSASGGMNRHHFCGRCGMQTWGDSPDWASAYNTDGTPKPGFDAGTVPEARIAGVNLRLIDGLDWSGIAVEKLDGRANW